MSQSACADDALAWFGVVADPARRLDRAIEARQTLAGKVVLEIGRHATSHALRHAARASQVYVVDLAEVRPPSGALPSNVSPIHRSSGLVPLRGRTVDVAILRMGDFGEGPFPLEACLLEFDRLLIPAGLAVGIQLGSEGDLGALLSQVLDGETRLEANRKARRIFEAAGFQEDPVETVWQAPGRSVLRRLLAAEWGDAEAFRSLCVSELSCSYRVFWRRKPA